MPFIELCINYQTVHLIQGKQQKGRYSWANLSCITGNFQAGKDTIVSWHCTSLDYLCKHLTEVRHDFWPQLAKCGLDQRVKLLGSVLLSQRQQISKLHCHVDWASVSSGYMYGSGTESSWSLFGRSEWCFNVSSCVGMVYECMWEVCEGAVGMMCGNCEEIMKMNVRFKWR